MAKNNSKLGAVIAFATIPVRYEGVVTEVSKAGVSILTRALGKQATVERFFQRKDIVAASATGEGFVVVKEARPIEGAAYYGSISTDNGNITVSVADAGDITFDQTDGINVQIHYDSNEAPSSDAAKIAKRASDKLATTVRRLAERSGNSKPKGDKKKKK